MFSLIKPALILFVLLSMITGVVYPFLVFGIAQAAFPYQANGSMVTRDRWPLGSALIGQRFDSPGYFEGRPSATMPMPYNALASTGSNLGPSNPVLIATAKRRLTLLLAANPDAAGPIPSELVMASASGLDPDISPHAAQWQAPRIAHARGMSLMQVRALISAHTQRPALGVFGEPRVNVLALNLALDAARGGAEDNPRQ